MSNISIVSVADLGADFDLGTVTTNKVNVVRAGASVPGVVTLNQIASIAASNPGAAATTTTLGVVIVGSGLLVSSGGLLTLNAAAVNLTGGQINGVTIGAGTPAPGNFTTLSSTNTANVNSIVTGAISSTGLNVSGSSNIGALTVAGNTALNGNTLIGDSPSDTLTVLSTTTFNSPVAYSGLITSTSTSSFQLPQGTSAQRSGGPGAIRLNTDVQTAEITLDGSVWAPLGGGPTGGGNDKIFELNGQTITANYSIPTSRNAVTAGPVTISTGITVTIPTGCGWSVV